MNKNFVQQSIAAAKAVAEKAIQSGLHGWEVSAHTLDGLAEMGKKVQNVTLFRSSFFDDDGFLIEEAFANRLESVVDSSDAAAILYEVLKLYVDASGRIVATEPVRMAYCQAFGKCHKTLTESHPTYKVYRIDDLVIAGKTPGEESYRGLEKAIRKGITIPMNGREIQYRFFVSSASQTRTDECWFYSRDVWKNHDKVMIHFYGSLWLQLKGKTVVLSKVMKYLGLLFSSVVKIDLGRPLKVGYVKILDSKGRNPVDGSCFMTVSLAKLIAEKLGIDPKTVKPGFALQGRVGSIVKCIAVAQPDKEVKSRYGDVDIVLNDSVVKVKDENGNPIMPEDLEKGIIHVCNTFHVDKSPSTSTFMHVIGMGRDDQFSDDLRKIIAEFVSYEVEAMKAALTSKESFLAYFGQNEDSIDLIDKAKAIVMENPNGINDPLVHKSLINLFKFKFRALACGKLGGMFLNLLLPDPSWYFCGTYDKSARTITYTEEQEKELFLQEGEVLSRLEGEKLLLTRSPSNEKGQMPVVTNVLYAGGKNHKAGNKTFRLNGVRTSIEEFFGLNCPWANVIYVSSLGETPIHGVLAGADFDGDTVKAAILEPSKSLKTSLSEEELAKKIGIWHKIIPLEGYKPFMAIGDTKNKPVAAPLTENNMIQERCRHLVVDNTGNLSNNASALADMAENLRKIKKVSELARLLTPSVIFVIGRMAYQAHLKLTTKEELYREKFDDSIVNQMLGLTKLYNFLVDNNLYKLMVRSKSAQLLNTLKSDLKLCSQFRKELLCFLDTAVQILCHLQMIQIDAAATGHYPDLDLFTFCRAQQKRINKDGTSEYVTAYPTWFAQAKGMKFDKNMFYSCSVQGLVKEIVTNAWNEFKQQKPDKPETLAGLNGKVSDEIKAEVNRLYSNATQAEMVAKILLDTQKFSSERLQRKAETFYKNIVRSGMKAKAIRLVDKHGLQPVLTAAYQLSYGSLTKEGGSQTRANFFLRYFGSLAAVYCSQLGLGYNVLFANVTEKDVVEDMSVMVVENNIYADDKVIGTCKCKDLLYGELKLASDRWVVVGNKAEIDDNVVSIYATEEQRERLMSGSSVLCCLANAGRTDMTLSFLSATGENLGEVMLKHFNKVKQFVDCYVDIEIDEMEMYNGKKTCKAVIRAV